MKLLQPDPDLTRYSDAGAYGMFVPPGELAPSEVIELHDCLEEALDLGPVLDTGRV